MNFIETIDYNIATFIHSFTSSSSFLTKLLRIITVSANMGLIFIVLGLLFILFKSTRKHGFIILLGLAIGYLFTNLILKNSIGRDRPFYDESSIYYTYWVSAGSLPQTGYSCPSGHATVSSVFGVTMFILCNKKYSWIYLLIPILFGFTRIYFMVHYFSDVILGTLVGLLSGIASYFIFKYLLKYQKVNDFICGRSVYELLRKKDSAND